MLTEPHSGLITVTELAEILRVSRGRAYELVRNKVIPEGVAIQIGRQWRIDRDALRDWMSSGGQGLSA